MAILELAAKSDDMRRSHLETVSRKQRYTSKTIQNDLINSIADVTGSAGFRNRHAGHVPRGLHKKGLHNSGH